MKRARPVVWISPRALVSLALAVQFGIMAYAGLILFLTPHGKEQQLPGWVMLGLGKREWVGLHMSSAALFLVLALVHLSYNWKTLTAYLRHRASRALSRRWEGAVALALGAICVFGTLQHWPPFSWLAPERGGTRPEAGLQRDAGPRDWANH